MRPRAAFAAQTIVLNTLGSLTNRENRFAAPRFSDDFLQRRRHGNVIGATDGFSDDVNGDKVPDLYPSLYPNVLNTGLINAPNYFELVLAPIPWPFQSRARLLAFPVHLPGAYTYPQILSARPVRLDPFADARVSSDSGRRNGHGITFEHEPAGLSAKYQPQPARPG